MDECCSVDGISESGGDRGGWAGGGIYKIKT